MRQQVASPLIDRIEAVTAESFGIAAETKRREVLRRRPFTAERSVRNVTGLRKARVMPSGFSSQGQNTLAMPSSNFNAVTTQDRSACWDSSKHRLDDAMRTEAAGVSRQKAEKPRVGLLRMTRNLNSRPAFLASGSKQLVVANDLVLLSPPICAIRTLANEDWRQSFQRPISHLNANDSESWVHRDSLLGRSHRPLATNHGLSAPTKLPDRFRTSSVVVQGASPRRSAD